jgi:hypothetical protein
LLSIGGGVDVLVSTAAAESPPVDEDEAKDNKAEENRPNKVL